MSNSGQVQSWWVTPRRKVAPLHPTSGILQRKCSCGGHTASSSECEACQKEKASNLVRPVVTNSESVSALPAIVHEVLGSPGQPLDAPTLAFMEPRFGHDFSKVRVHTDTKAGESAAEVGAAAYTIGQQVVFAPGRYAP